jgi:hypothetical protein
MIYRYNAFQPSDWRSMLACAGMATYAVPEEYRATWELVAQGAEAVRAPYESPTRVAHVVKFVVTFASCDPHDLQRVYFASFLGQPAVIKERFSKSYRHPVLDERLLKERLAWVRAVADGRARDVASTRFAPPHSGLHAWTIHSAGGTLHAAGAACGHRRAAAALRGHRAAPAIHGAH